jgi:hypothetical protein
MRMPPRSPDMETAKERLHNEIGITARVQLEMVDDIARSGFADKRWCAIARTHFEEGEMALHRAIRDFPGDDPNRYGKTPSANPLPKSFEPPVEPQTNISEDSTKQVEWSDYDADGNLKPPEKPR